MYYLLNTVFGDVYFSTESSTSLPSNYQYTRTPASVMFKELIGDLRYAVEHLPEHIVKLNMDVQQNMQRLIYWLRFI